MEFGEARLCFNSLCIYYLTYYRDKRMKHRLIKESDEEDARHAGL